MTLVGVCRFGVGMQGDRWIVDHALEQQCLTKQTMASPNGDVSCEDPMSGMTMNVPSEGWGAKSKQRAGKGADCFECKRQGVGRGRRGGFPFGTGPGGAKEKSRLLDSSPSFRRPDERLAAFQR